MRYILLISLVITQLTGLHGNHHLLQQLYDKYVSASGVDYQGLVSDGKLLDMYCAELATSRPDLNDRSAGAKAYWMNAYNAFTLKLIVDHFPVSSIMDLHEGNPWDVAWIQLGDKSFTLNQIEKEILIKDFGDARVHFAINCAAKSCPPLSATAFTESNVEDELERLTTAFLANPKFNTVATTGSKLSKIFDWYAADFGDVSAFVKRYTGVESGSLTYHDYDWQLNSK